MPVTIEEMEEDLRKKQNTARFRHTLGVQYTSICLAMRYGEDIERAGLAGLLHDCAKHMDPGKLLKKCEKYYIPVSDAERESPYLLHGKVGALRAFRKYGVRDKEILGAIAWHTTGHPGMTLLEEIVFTADYIEPGRTHAQNLSYLRRLAFTDLDRAVAEISKQTLDYLKEGGQQTDPTTEETYNYYRDLIQARPHADNELYEPDVSGNSGKGEEL